ncbi:hypothetical protein Tco_1493342 [Tanacetum coccineum]
MVHSIYVAGGGSGFEARGQRAFAEAKVPFPSDGTALLDLATPLNESGSFPPGHSIFSNDELCDKGFSLFRILQEEERGTPRITFRHHQFLIYTKVSHRVHCYHRFQLPPPGGGIIRGPSDESTASDGDCFQFTNLFRVSNGVAVEENSEL